MHAKHWAGLTALVVLSLPAAGPDIFKPAPWQSTDINRVSYDVIIIGSGIGGLTSASLLAASGYHVLVLEQSELLGGYCGSFKRTIDGTTFTFNTGAFDISGIWNEPGAGRGPITYLVEQLGIKYKNLFAPHEWQKCIDSTHCYRFGSNTERNSHDITTIAFNSLKKACRDANHDWLSATAAKQLRKFLDNARLAYIEAYSEGSLYWGIPLMGNERIKELAPLLPEPVQESLKKYPATHPHLMGWMHKTFAEKLDEDLSHEQLAPAKELLKSLMEYVGTDATQVPAKDALFACLSYFLFGGHHVIGGTGEFPRALADVVTAHGGAILTQHRASKILTENLDGAPHAYAVQSVDLHSPTKKNVRFYAPIIVANANAKTVFDTLVDRSGLDEQTKKTLTSINTLAMSRSSFVVQLGLTGKSQELANMPTINDGVKIIARQNDVTTIMMEDNADIQTFQHDQPDYEATKRRKAREMIAAVDKAQLPGLLAAYDRYEKRMPTPPSEPDALVVRAVDIATPETFQNHTGMPEGAIYAFAAGGKHPVYKTPIKGLYLASASVLGGGVESAVIAGIMCAHDIRGWKNVLSVPTNSGWWPSWLRWW